MTSNLIPKDNQEFSAFIRKFADALVENAGGDQALSDAGKAMLEKVGKFIQLDDKSLVLSKEKKAVNREKYELKGDLREQIIQHNLYLKYRHGKSTEEMEKFRIPGRIPSDNQEFIDHARKFAHALVENARDDKVLTDAGKAMLEKVELFISLDEKSLAVTADKKAVNREKYGVKDELIDDATQMICYLKYKLGRTAEELEKFHI